MDRSIVNDPLENAPHRYDRLHPSEQTRQIVVESLTEVKVQAFRVGTTRLDSAVLQALASV